MASKMELRSRKKRSSSGVATDNSSSKKTKKQQVKVVLPRDVWVKHIFPFLGPGQFAYVAGVCHEWKEFYLAYFSTIDQEKVPIVVASGWRRKGKATDTYYSVSLCSTARAKYCLARPPRAEKNPIGKSNILACTTAASGGHLEVLKFLRQEGFPWSTSVCEMAARNGHLVILRWARSQDPPCPWDDSTCFLAARNGHLEILQWTRSQDPPCPWSTSTCAAAARCGQLEILQWLRSQDPPCPWDSTNICSLAAWGGHVDVAKWAHENGCPWD